MTFDTEEFDVGSMHSTSSNTSRVTIPTGAGGVYVVIGSAMFAANATGLRQSFFMVNGTVVNFRHQDAAPSGSATSRLNLAAVLALSAGDYVEFGVRQTSGGSLNAGSTTDDQRCRLMVARLW